MQTIKVHLFFALNIPIDRFLCNHLGKIKLTMNQVMFVGMTKCSSYLDNISQEKVAIKFRNLLHYRKVAEIHLADNFVDVSGISPFTAETMILSLNNAVSSEDNEA